MTTVEDLLAGQTEDEITDAIAADLVSEGATPTTWKSGSPTLTIVAAFARALSSFSALQVLIAKSGFLDEAEGAWLTLVARYVYGVERIEATFATGEVTLTNTAGGVYSGAAGDLVFTSSTTGKSYRSTDAFSLGAAPDTTTVNIEAVELGSDSTAAAGAIDELETVLSGVTVSNAAAVVGTDEEKDERLRERCREKTGVASPNGPKDAYSFFAKAAAREDGSSIGVTRVRAIPDGVGGLDVYVADADGAVAAADVAVIQEYIVRNCEPLGITATVSSATALTVDVTYDLWVRDDTGYSDAELEALVQTGLEEFLATVPIGGVILPGESGKVFHQAIAAALAEALPDGSFIDAEITTPAADTTAAASEAPLVGTVTATIHQVSEYET